MRGLNRHNPRRVVWLLVMIVVGAMCSLLQQSWAQSNVTRRQANKTQKETYTRPKPSRPITPEIPSQDRYVTNRVFLERADSLYHYEWAPDRQVVSGNVYFRQGGMSLYCDSAYYFSELNSLYAFGHVKMQSGDTLTALADRMYYDGDQKLARLRNGGSRPKVTVQNRRVTLTADSMFYSVVQDRGWYDCGGRVEDNLNVLTSRYGEYSPSTKQADFFGNVVLKGKSSGNVLYTDTLYYNTATNVARVTSHSWIYTKTDTIETWQATYNTRSGNASLESRSTVAHRDSSGNVTKLTGDRIVYDKASGISRVYMFENPSQNPRPMVLNDTARKVRLIANYGEYDDVRRSAFATGYPLLVEYSRPDTNYLRADTIYTWVVQHKVLPEYDEAQKALYDSLQEEQRALDAQADSAERVYHAALEAGDSTMTKPVRRNLADEIPELHRDTVMRDFSVSRAVSAARFFNQQIQGIADTLLLVQYDSLLYMRRKPVVWSDQRQVFGDTIVVHFNDSTSDYGRVANGFVAEYVAEDFYNQLKGKRMYATFADNTLKHLEVDDNVEALLLPAEKDSTYNKIIRAESEHLTLDMDDREMEKLKMWSAVDGTVTPIFKAKRADQYLQGFQWLEGLRPRREWYIDRWRWDDDLGDVPDDLRDYFSEPDHLERGDQMPDELRNYYLR